MDQNPQTFEAFVLGAAVPIGFFVYQGLVIPLNVYQVLRLSNIKAPPKPNCQFQRKFAILNCPSLWEEKTTIFR